MNLHSLEIPGFHRPVFNDQKPLLQPQWTPVKHNVQDASNAWRTRHWTAFWNLVRSVPSIGLSWQNITPFWFVLQPGRIGYWVGVGWVTNARCPRKLVSAVLGAVREGRHGIHQLHGILTWGMGHSWRRKRLNARILMDSSPIVFLA